MYQALLDAVLTKQQRQSGLKLAEQDDHTVLLVREGKTLARFSIYSTIQTIREVADQFVEEGGKRDALREVQAIPIRGYSGTRESDPGAQNAI